MEFFSRLRPTKTTSVPKNNRDSSDEDNKPSKSDKNDKKLYASPASSKWPPHLQDLYDELSVSDPGEGLKPALKLLHMLKLDATACDSLHHNGVIQEMASELGNGTIQFDTKLTGRGSVLIPIFQHLVALDLQAAQRFVRLCDKKTLPVIVGTVAYDCLQALLQGQPSSDHHKAKREVEFFVATVKDIVKEGPDACVKELEPFIRGCPEDARQKVLRNLANETVSEACRTSPQLAAAVGKLQEGAAVTRSESDIKLAPLVLGINIAMSAVDRVEKEFQFDAEVKGEMVTVDKFSFFEKENIISLFQSVEMIFQEKDFDLSALIAKLCRGAKTVPSHARFVGGLMRYLVDAKQGKFDFDTFLEAVLLSNMPSTCAKQIVSPSLMVTLQKYEVDWNFCSDMRKQVEKPMTMLQFVALKQLATEARYYADKSGNRDLVEYVDFAIKDCEEIINELTEKISAPHQQDFLASQKAILEEKRKALLASLDLESALHAIASPNMEDKFSAAASIFDKIVQGKSDVDQVIAQLMIDNTPQAVELLGALAAIYLADGNSKLFIHIFVETIKNTERFDALARGVTHVWYQRGLDRSPLLDHTNHLCESLCGLIGKVNQQALESVFFNCKAAIEDKIKRITRERIARPLQMIIDSMRVK